MKYEEFISVAEQLLLAFPGQIAATKKTYLAWFQGIKDLPTDRVRKAVNMILTEVEQIYPGTNLAAMIRNRATPTITEATVAAHLNRALDVYLNTKDDPRAVLRKVSPRLVAIAERSGIFNRQASVESTRIAVQLAAKQFVEEHRNARKGFAPPDATPMTNRIEGPKAVPELTDEQRESGLAKIREITRSLTGDRRAT